MNRRTRGAGPAFVRYFGPVLSALAELGGSARPPEVYDWVARALKVSEAERSEVMRSGNLRFENQVAWARFYLTKAGLIDASRHGVWSLTDKGKVAVGITAEQAVELFQVIAREFRKGRVSAASLERTEANDDVEDERMAPTEAASPLATDHRQEILAALGDLEPAGFERFCQRILRESGFQEVSVTGRSGDGGIDGIGILQVGPFVTFRVLFQCKRYSGVVTPSQIRDFRGAMMGRADRGIVITTGSFTTEAKREAGRDGVPPIDLVDGERLVKMLEDLELGLVATKAFRLDRQFFRDFET